MVIRLDKYLGISLSRYKLISIYHDIFKKNETLWSPTKKGVRNNGVSHRQESEGNMRIVK